MASAMGYILFDHLPKYVAVQVSEERWAVAVLRDEAEHGSPEYVIMSKGMKKGECHNALVELQRKERTGR